MITVESFTEFMSVCSDVTYEDYHHCLDKYQLIQNSVQKLLNNFGITQIGMTGKK